MDPAADLSHGLIGSHPIPTGLSWSPAIMPRGSAKRHHLGVWFLRVAHRCDSRRIAYSGDGSVSYRDVRIAAEEFARALRANPDFSPGSRVVLLLENSVDYLAAFYGTLIADGTAVPVHPQMEFDRVPAILELTEPHSVVLTVSGRDAVSANMPGHSVRPCPGLPHCVWMVPENKQRRSEAGRQSRGGRARAETRPAVILFTSGSTAAPKGVMLSHGNLVANALSIRRILRIRRQDCALAPLPFHGAFGNSVLQSHVLAGSSLVLERSVVCADAYQRALRQHPVTGLYGVPDQVRFLLHHDWPGAVRPADLRYFAVAGGALFADESRALSERIAPAEVILMYGQTEATARLSYLPAQEWPRRPSSIGRGIPGTTLQVVDRRGRLVPPGRLGELRARGPGVMLGYWRDPEATRKVLRNGWLYTGDLATVDEEGFITIQGRKNQWVKIAGNRIHPCEIEQYLRGRFPGGEFAAVPCQTPAGGTRLAVFFKSDRSVPLSNDALIAACRGHFSGHKVPVYVEGLDELPHTASGKLAAAELADRATRQIQARWARESR